MAVNKEREIQQNSRLSRTVTSASAKDSCFAFLFLDESYSSLAFWVLKYVKPSVDIVLGQVNLFGTQPRVNHLFLFSKLVFPLK